MALADYYQAVREEEVNRATAALLQEFRQIAKDKYEVAQATQQDVLQADVDLAGLESRRAELQRDRRVARHGSIPAPSGGGPSVAAAAGPGDRGRCAPGVEALRESAVRRRPDLAAQLARIRMAEANLELAAASIIPDVELVAKYDAFMPVDIRRKWG